MSPKAAGIVSVFGLQVLLQEMFGVRRDLLRELLQIKLLNLTTSDELDFNYWLVNSAMKTVVKSKDLCSQLLTHCCRMGTSIKHPVPDRVKPHL